MGDLFFILIVLAVLLAFVTVIGHGLWLLIAFLFSSHREGATKANATQPVEGESCPRCLTVFRSSEATCAVCNWPEGLPTGDRRASAVLAVRRQLYLYHQLGLVGIESFQRLVAALDEAARPAATAAATTDLPASEAATAEATDIPLAAVAPAEFVAPDVVTAELVDAKLVDAAIASTPLGEKVATRVEPRTEPSPNPRSSILNPSIAPAAPRPALGKLLSAFLEEKNIRWGELVGGLLIVGCSIALVISFWSEITQRPILKFSLFNGVSAALFAVGLYTHCRWKLDTTSRGLLIVAMLLLPLNFLAIAAFTSQSPPTDALSLGGEAASLALFAVLSYFAARVLTPDVPHLLAAGVMIPSIMQLLARRFGDADMPMSLLYALAAAPLAYYAATVGGAIRKVTGGCGIEDRGLRAGDGNTADSFSTSDRVPSQSSIPHPQSSLLTEQLANRLFILLGLATFATLLPLGLLIFKTEALWPTLRQLAPLAVLAGMPALGVGLLFLKSSVPRALVREQTAGIAIGVLGATIMVSSLLLAWPHPQLLFVSALFTATAFLFVALRFAVPQAHLVVGVCGSVMALVVYNVASGAIEWNAGFAAPLSSVMLSATSGNVLAVVCAAYLLLAYLLRRADRNDDALWWSVAAGMTALVSLAFVTVFGLGCDGDPHGVTWTYAFFTIALAAASLKLDRRSIVWAASTMLLVALVQGIVFRYGDAWQLTAPWTTAVMLHATIATAVAAIAAYSARLRAPNARRAWCTSAEIVSIVAVAALAFQVISLSWAITATYFAWLAVVWLALAILVREPVLFTAFQAALAFSLVCFVTTFLTDRVWYLVADFPWLDPWFLQTQGIALAGYCLVWIALRIGLKRGQFPLLPNRSWHKLLEPPYPALDRLCELFLLVMLLALSVYAAAPFAAQELAPLDRPGLATRVVPPVEHAIADMPIEHAAGDGAWLLLAAVALVLVVGCWESRPRWRGLGLLLVAAAICPLIASRWAADVSAASALRWSVAGFAVAASLPLWLRNPAQRSLRTLGIDFGAGNDAALWPNSMSAFRTVVSIYLGTHLAMVAYVAIAVVEKSGVPTDLLALLQGLIVLAVAVVLIVALVKLAERTSAASAADVVDAIVVDRSQESGEIRQATTSSSYLLTPGSHATSSSLALNHWQTLALFLGIGPLFVTYSFLIASALRQHPLVGPEPDAWFRTIGWSVSYGVPLVVFAITLLGHAIRERSSRIAFAAGLLFNLIGTVVFLLELAKAQRPLDGSAWIEVAQVNAIVAALMALGWLAAVRWRRHASNVLSSATNAAQAPSLDALDPLASIEHARPHETKPLPRLLTTQVVIASALWMLATLPAIVGLVIEPEVWPWVATAGGPIGWAASALTFAALGLWAASEARQSQRQLTAFLVHCAIPVAVVLVALVGAYYDTGNWLGYHALLAGTTLGTWLLAISPRWFADDARHAKTSDWTSSVFNRYVVAHAQTSVLNSVFAVTTALLAIRALDGDPQSPWWTLAALLSTTLSSIYLAWTSAARGYLWFAGLLFPLAATIWWDELSSDFIVAATIPAVLTHVLYVNVIAAAAMVVVSAFVERLRIMPSKVAAELPPVGFHRFASWACLGVMFVATWIGLTQDQHLMPVDANLTLTIAALIAVAVATVACATDAATKFFIARLWLCGLLGVLVYLDTRNLHDDPFIIALAPLLGAYTLISSIAWSLRARIAQVFRIEDRGWRIEGAADTDQVLPRSSILHPQSSLLAPGHAWLLFANGALTLLVVALSFWIDLSIVAANLRTGAALAILATALSIALLAEGVVQAPTQFAALILGVLFGIALSWARLPLAIEAGILHRAVAAAVAMAAVIPVYALGLGKLAPAASHWPRTVQRVVPFITVVASLVLVGVLSLEVAYFAEHRVVPMRWPAMVAVLAALVTLALAALAAAVLPGRDPLSLSERGRTVYVYAAEILLALAFLHIRVTMPWLFSGWFSQFWPIVIVAIAFLGVGFAELCRRKRVPVLSEPLENTGALLPLLPTVAFWTYPSQVNYSLLLLSVAALYSVLCLLRKSFAFAMLSALAANGSLWYWLYRTQDLGLEQHPQLWLIPPALCVLAAAQWNRRRLSDDQMTAIRYLSAIVVYASSTADVFLNGVGEAPWLPVALAGLSIVGIFAGILLRVRAFLYLGTSFLMVALFTVIWHAAVEQERTWIWWVTGIVAGILIIALFGLFEKKRDDLLRLVDKIRQWE